MSNQDTELNILSLMNEEETISNTESNELLIKSNNKGKEKESTIIDIKPPVINEKRSNSSLTFDMKSSDNNRTSYSITSKGKEPQKLYGEPISDADNDADFESITYSDISDFANNKKQKSPHSLRNKRFSYNSPSTSTGNQKATSSNNNINSAPSTSSTPASQVNASSSSNNNTNNNTGSNSHRPSLASHGLSGSFAELFAAINAVNNSNSTNNNSVDVAANPSSRQNSLSNIQNFYRLGLTENITVDPHDHATTSTGTVNHRPTQVGPGQTAWMLFRYYSLFKCLWSLLFCTFFISNYINGSKSCDSRIFKFSIVLTVLYGIQTISCLLLIVYLPSIITRYNSAVRRRVVMSMRAWKITIYSIIVEVVMVVIGAYIIIEKDPKCGLGDESELVYARLIKYIVIVTISFYTLLCLPILILPCTLTFKLLPEYKGIEESVLKRFSTIIYNPTEEVDEDDAPCCSICMENYEPGTKIKRLPCKHEYHPECIVQWLETNNSCPICRQTFF